MWHAYEILCEMGCDISGDTFFSHARLCTHVNIKSASESETVNISVPSAANLLPVGSLSPSFSPTLQDSLTFPTKSNPPETEICLSPTISRQEWMVPFMTVMVIEIFDQVMFPIHI